MNIFLYLQITLKQYQKRVLLAPPVFSLLFASLFFSPLALTKEENKEAINENASTLQCSDPSNSLLWTAKGKNSTVHLFGSIHIGAKHFYPLNEKIENTFQSSDHLVFEINPQSMMDPKIAIELQTRSILPNNETLDQHVSKETVKAVKNALSNYGLPADAYMMYRPWFLTMLLTNMQVISMGYMPQYGLEQYLLREKPESIDILELETFESQLDLLESLDEEVFLQYTLSNLEKGKATTRALMNAWQCGDKETLNALFASEFEIEGRLKEKVDDFMKKLLFDRNINMADSIEKFLREGSGTYFIVVGAAHYVGDKSIIQILENKGFKIINVRL